MTRLESVFNFQGTHCLPICRDKRSRRHGHSFIGVVTIDVVEPLGDEIFINVSDSIHRIVNRMLEEYLDFHDLNETTDLKNPTSEALAEWIYNRLAPIIAMLRRGESTEDLIELISVEVKETCTCSATYIPTRRIREDYAGSNPKHPITQSPGTKKGRRP